MFLEEISKKQLNKTQKQLFFILIFLLKMLILSIPIYIVLIFNIQLSPLQNAVIEQSISLFETTGFNPVREGYFIHIDKTHEFVFGISEDCTPWKSSWLLISLIIAVPGIMIQKRFIGMVVGLITLWVSNLARIFLIVFVEQYNGLSNAMFIHDYLWKPAMVLIVLAFWVSWLRWNKPEWIRYK